MAKNIAGVTTISVGAAIQNANDSLPVVYSQDIQGGLTTVETRANLLAIPARKLQEGMIVYQQQAQASQMLGNFPAGYYRFNPNATANPLTRDRIGGFTGNQPQNANWEEIQLDVDTVTTASGDPVNPDPSANPPVAGNPVNPHAGDLYLNIDNNTLWYYGTSWIQVNSATATTVASIDNIGDVDTSGKSGGDLLQWNATDSRWEDTEFTLDQYIGNPQNRESDIIGQLDHLPAIRLSTTAQTFPAGTPVATYSPANNDTNIELVAGSRELPLQLFRVVFRLATSGFTFAVNGRYSFNSSSDNTFTADTSNFYSVEDIIFTWDAELGTALGNSTSENEFIDEIISLRNAGSAVTEIDSFILATRTLSVANNSLWTMELETTATPNANDIGAFETIGASLYLNPNQAGREFDLEIQQVFDLIDAQFNLPNVSARVIFPFIIVQTLDTSTNQFLDYRFPLTAFQNVNIGNGVTGEVGQARRFTIRTDMVYDSGGELVTSTGVISNADLNAPGSNPRLFLNDRIEYLGIGFFGGLTDLLNNNIIRDYNIVRNNDNRITGIREFNLGVNNDPLLLEAYSRAEVDDRVEEALQRVHSNGTTHFIEQSLPIPSSATNLNVLVPGLPSAQQTTFRIDPNRLTDTDDDIIVNTLRSINTQPFVSFDINRYEPDFMTASGIDLNRADYEATTFTGRIVSLDQNIDANNIESIQVAIQRNTLATGTSTTPEADLIALVGSEFYFNLNNQGLTAVEIRDGITPSAIGPFDITSVETSTVDPTLLFVNLNGELAQISQADQNTIRNINSAITTATEKAFDNALMPDYTETQPVDNTFTAGTTSHTYPGGTVEFRRTLQNTVIEVVNVSNTDTIVIRARYRTTQGAVNLVPFGENGVFTIGPNNSQSISYDPTQGTFSGTPAQAVIDIFYDEFDRENQFTVGEPIDFHRVLLASPVGTDVSILTTRLPGTSSDISSLNAIRTGSWVLEFTGTGGEIFQGIYRAGSFRFFDRRVENNHAILTTASAGQWFPRVPVQADIRTTTPSTRVRMYRVDPLNPTQSVFYYVNESTLGPANNPTELINQGNLLIDGRTPYDTTNTLIEAAVPTQAVYPINNTIDIGYFSGVIQSQNLEIVRVVRDPINGTTVFNHDNTYTDSAGTIVDADRFFRGFYRSDTLALVFVLRQVHVMMDGTTETTWADWDGQINRFQTIGALADFVVTPQSPITLNDYAYLYQVDGTNMPGLYRRNVTNTGWIPVVFNRNLPTA